MSMKVKAMILLVIFSAILYLPFSVHAANGNIFRGLPIPILNSGGSGEEENVSMEQYAESLPKPQLNSSIAQYGVDIEYMRNHMNILKQKGQSTKQCAACHTNREEFCDRCHNYAGVSPKIDY